MRKRNLHLPTILLAVSTLVAGSMAAAHGQDNVPPKPAKETYAPDIKPEALWDGRKMAPFKSLDDPKMVKAADADFLDDSEYVLGAAHHGENRAYPTRFIWWHHAVNDAIGLPEKGGKTPVAITYCSVCNTGIAYDRRLDDTGIKHEIMPEIKLDFYGLYNGVAALCERESGSAFLQGEGRFVTGPLSGKSLKMLSLLDTTWGEWKKLHPDTLVMSPDNSFSKNYRPRDKPEPRGYEFFPAPFFKPTVTRGDKRLPPFDKVLGVTLAAGEKSVGEKTAEGELKNLRRAYPIKVLAEAGGAVNDQLGGTPLTVFLQSSSTTAGAFLRKLDGKTLTFEARKQNDGKVAFFDKETGSRWNIEGKAEEGTLAGKSLQRIDNNLSQWYGWAAYFPDTSIFGRADPPQPGNPFDQPGVGDRPVAPAKP